MAPRRTTMGRFLFQCGQEKWSPWMRKQEKGTGLWPGRLESQRRLLETTVMFTPEHAVIRFSVHILKRAMTRDQPIVCSGSGWQTDLKNQPLRSIGAEPMSSVEEDISMRLNSIASIPFHKMAMYIPSNYKPV